MLHWLQHRARAGKGLFRSRQWRMQHRCRLEQRERLKQRRIQFANRSLTLCWRVPHASQPCATR
eukprot:3256704-Pleurochrysis_carterae.AAC.1